MRQASVEQGQCIETTVTVGCRSNIIYDLPVWSIPTRRSPQPGLAGIGEGVSVCLPFLGSLKKPRLEQSIALPKGAEWPATTPAIT